MNVVLFLEETLQVLGAETVGVACVAVLLFAYTQVMRSHKA